MNRFSGKRWLEDRPLGLQIWLRLSLWGSLLLATVYLYLIFIIFPGQSWTREQGVKLLSLFLMMLIANIFLAKALTRPLAEPFEKLSENMGKMKNKNWDEKILQVSRKDEIGKIINTLSDIQRNVMDINEDEELFYQSLSHGLKTPIMVIRNCCQAYYDGIYGSEAIDIIMKESSRLEKAIHKLVYVSSFDHMLAKQSEVRPINLYDLCMDCRKRFAGNPKAAAIWVELAEDTVVMGNAASLQTVFDNIIENALRYVNSYIRIGAERGKEGLTLVFENDGEPIPPKTMEQLFEKFCKSENGKFGLGMYIAKKIVAFHGGEIWAGNFENGVRFFVLLRQPIV